MNKKIKMYFEELGFTVEKNNAYGKIKGYEVSANVYMLDTVAPVKLHVNLYATDEVKNKMVSEILSFKFKAFNISYDLYGIALGFNDPLTVGKLLKRMPEMIDKIFGVFQKYDAKGIGYCPICGEELKEDSKKYKIEWASITMDVECVKGLNAEIQAENEDFKDAPNNYLKGTAGALLGGLVGFVAFIVLFFLGFISALTALISILLGTYLYKKLEGKPNAVMVIIVSVVSVLSMVLALTSIYYLYAQGVALEYDFTSIGVQAFKDMLTVPEFKNEYISNLAMTLFYTFLGIIFEIVQLSKSVKRQGEIK